MADQYNYVIKFPNRGDAFLNSVIGPYLAAQQPSLTTLWVYDLRQGGVVTLPGYWAILTSDGPNNTLATDPHLQFAIDLNLATLTGNGVTGCVISNIDDGLLENIQIVTAYGGYIENGLIPPPHTSSGFSWELEDGSGFWLLENKSGYWELEEGP